MTDKRMHRGPHPEDEELFATDMGPRLREATSDLSWLLTREYSMVSSVKLVGDRYQLKERQRLAVMRCACSDQSLQRRQAHRVSLVDVKGRAIFLDGYNVLTSVEAALGRGVILQARDGCYRDMASMHGTYRRVAETVPAISLIGECLASWQVASCTWYLDRPVSNSGRLKTILTEEAARARWDWIVELVQNPDTLLADSYEIIATADSVILDKCKRWVNLAREVIQTMGPGVRIVDLSGLPPVTARP